ncbi:MAG TPA: hypothetical protein VJX23_06195 [Candidatus Binataceae bacterium]|nr:hypothetical protein [Candidatus Binataceae bacterium]
MIKKIAICLAMALLAMGAGAAGAEVRIGVGVVGPISPQTEADIENLVGALPNVKAVPIQPPGDADACVKRFVAGEADDHLDAVMVVRLPTDSFHVQQDDKEAKFTGTYEIWTLNLSTLAEDRHAFTFTDSETVVSGPAAILSIPAQLFVERATGKKLLSSSSWQAYEAVQTRVEAKLIAATKLYLSTSTIRDTQPLNMLTCAQALVDRGDADTALLVFKAAGVDNPQVRQLMVTAQAKLKRAKAEGLLGETLGAIAGGDSHEASTTLAQYQAAPEAEPARADAISRALAVESDHRADYAYRQILTSDVPGLDHAAFVAMMTQMFADVTGTAPDEVMVSDKDVTIEAKKANDSLKTALDAYADALGKAAWLMSMKCGCDAAARLTADPSGLVLLRARFAPSFTRAEVGLP